MKAITVRFNTNIPSDREIENILDKKTPIEVENGVYLVGTDLIKHWIYKGMAVTKSKFPDSFCDAVSSVDKIDVIKDEKEKEKEKKDRKRKFDIKSFSTKELGGTEPCFDD